MKKILILLSTAVCACSLVNAQQAREATKDDGNWFFVDTSAIPADRYNTDHFQHFGKGIDGYNAEVLRAIDIVQSHAMDGGGYFTGIKAQPTESPIGYQLKLFDKSLLDPPRTTSYCSGSTYGVFIEALNRILPDGGTKISADRLESLRMQEPDGSRRDDEMKYWGKWNDDGWGSQYALVQYSGMGEDISPQRARPGDFMNISWKSGLGHSVVFLGWIRGEHGFGMVYWSSQKSTNGFSDVVLCPLSNVKSVRIVRIVHPERLYTFDVSKTVERDLPGDTIDTTTAFQRR